MRSACLFSGTLIETPEVNNMEWMICFFLCAAVLLLGFLTVLLQGVFRIKKLQRVNGFRLLFAAVAVSSVVLFVPFYFHQFQVYDCSWFEALMIVLYNTIRLFLVNGEYELLAQILPTQPQWLNDGYTFLYSVLLILAPVMTFGFALSFIQNLSARLRYVLRFGSNLCIFSELSEKSLALATSMDREIGGYCFVFTGVTREEEKQDLLLRANALGAICFADDISAVRLSFHSKKKEMRFFLIREDETDNVTQALKLTREYRDRERTWIYVFSTHASGELLLSSACDSGEDTRPVRVKVRRINRIRSLIYRTLLDTGVANIFEAARQEGEHRHINALVVGMGAHGAQMIKALSWYGQMTGYRLTIHATDISPTAHERLYSACPELFAPSLNHHFDIPGEVGCSITLHPETDVHSSRFQTLLEGLPPVTYVFVALGNDEANIAAAAHLRSLLEGMGLHPAIQTVVYDSQMKNALQGVRNYKNQSYDIDFIGDLESSYSQKVILGTDLEQEALTRHMLYGKEADFWQFDYNYNSSVASAIHLSAKQALQLPGIHQKPAQRSESDRQMLRVLEHCRWNAYMRSEGYCYAPVRNDLAKKHPCLVPFDRLPLKEQEKDDV